jgi:signal transduction histidine kinase
MEDLERTLVLLRELPDREATERPGLDQLPQLLDTARAAGSRVVDRIEVTSGQLPGVLSREAFRIVQEAVTNALRYAPGAAVELRVAVEDGQLRLSCANPMQAGLVQREPRWGRSGGKGLRGIRERASLLGGTASAGPVEGSWVLDVRLPLRLGA